MDFVTRKIDIFHSNGTEPDQFGNALLDRIGNGNKDYYDDFYMNTLGRNKTPFRYEAKYALSAFHLELRQSTNMYLLN